MGEITVVGKQKKSAGILVEPANREDALIPHFLRKEFQHRFLLRISGSRNDSRGFIHQVVMPCPIAEDHTIH